MLAKCLIYKAKIALVNVNVQVHNVASLSYVVATTERRDERGRCSKSSRDVGTDRASVARFD